MGFVNAASAHQPKIKDGEVVGGIAGIFRAYLILTKPRIVSLILFTEYCAMVVAGNRIPTPRETPVGIIGLALSAGGAAVINVWYDRDIDGIMGRTMNRPLPKGIVKPSHALWFGLGLGVGSIVLFLVTGFKTAALLSAAGYVYYAVVYTMLLKRRTPQNIVVGGGAGAFGPLVGWSIVAGPLTMTPIWMFAVIFFWTPSHFWGLALYKKEDYARAGVPMMPVVRGVVSTTRGSVTLWNNPESRATGWGETMKLPTL